MRNLLIVFFVLILLLMVLIFPIKSRCMAHFNLLEKKGFYSIKIFVFKILCGMVYIKNGKLFADNVSNALFDSYSSPFMKKFIAELMAKMDVKKMEVFFTGGFKENSFSSAILCGGLSSAVHTFYSYLSQKYEGVKLYEDIKPTFGKDNLELTFDIVISISLFQIIMAVFAAAIKNRKERRV